MTLSIINNQVKMSYSMKWLKPPEQMEYGYIY